MKYKLVIFDFDGTLADSSALFLDVWDQLADHYKFAPVDRTATDLLRNLGARQLIRQQRIPFWKLPFIMRRARAMMARDVGRIRLFPGMEKVFEHLTRNEILIAVVTSNSRANVLHVLGENLAAQITILEGGVSLFGKAAKLRKVVRRLRIQPERTLAVGDEIRDADAARDAGIPFGAVAWGFTQLEALIDQAPAEIFQSVEDIEQITGYRLEPTH